MSIDSQFKIPADASANVHSVSAVGEQYLDLVSAGGATASLARPDCEHGHRAQRDRPGAGRRQPRPCVLPKEKIGSLLDETSESVGGWARRCSGWSTPPR